MSYLPCPDTTVGCVRRTHLGNISRKRSGVVPTHDAQLPGDRVLIRENCTPVSVLVAPRRTHRHSARVTGVQRLYKLPVHNPMGTPWWIVCPCAPIYPHMGRWDSLPESRIKMPNTVGAMHRTCHAPFVPHIAGAMHHLCHALPFCVKSKPGVPTREAHFGRVPSGSAIFGNLSPTRQFNHLYK